MTATVDKKPRDTSKVGARAMEERPTLSEKEREDLIASLEAAEVRIAAGEFVEHDPDTFVDRLIVVRDAAIRSKKA